MDERTFHCIGHSGGVILLLALSAPEIAGWSSLVARRAHNPEVVGSNPAPATMNFQKPPSGGFFAVYAGQRLVSEMFEHMGPEMQLDPYENLSAMELIKQKIEDEVPLLRFW